MKNKNKRKSIQEIQDEIFRKMPIDKKMRLTFCLNRLVGRIAEDSIKEQYPEADNAFIKEKLRERTR
ncbi:MAG: hypothetical protein DDT18_01665 [Actinobacteria bacterium]|nr:hypothetical protein [Actinomycetota bacterium]